MAKKRSTPPEVVPDPSMVHPNPVDEIAPSALPGATFVRGSAKAEVKATNSMGMKLWLYSPARVVLLTDPTRKLAEVAHARGYASRKIESVDVILDTATRRLFVYPPDPQDQVDDAFEVSYRSEGLHAEFNIRSLLQPHGLEVTRGWREQYAVKYDPKSDCGPALVFQLTLNPPREKYRRGKKDVIEDGVPPDSTPKKAPTKAPKAAASTGDAATAAKAESAPKKSTQAKAEGKVAADAKQSADPTLGHTGAE